MRGITRARWFAGAAVLALTATACGGGDEGAEEPAAESGGEFSIQIGEPEHLIPTNTNESEGSQVLQTLYTGLISYDPETTEPINVIADSIESEDNKLWTITLKDGWTFHNSEPVTAQSFVNAWNYGAYGPNAQGNSYFFDRIVGYTDLQSTDPDGDGPQEAPPPAASEMSGLRAVDDTTIQVELAEPFSQFPLMLGYQAFYPMADECLADVPACEEAPIGNGPFKMDGSWQHNQAINLVKNEDFAGEPAKADRVTFAIYDQLETAYNDWLAGNLDITDAPPEKYVEAKERAGDAFIERESSNFTYVGFPLYQPQFQNKLVRQAFSMAIDRQAIIDAVFNGRFTPAKSLVSPVVLGSREDACQYCDLDVDAAKAKLAEAGGFTGPLELWFNAGAGHDVWMQAVGDQLRTNLGVEYTLKGDLQFADYLGLLDEKKITGAFRLGWIMDYPSPENYLKPIHGTQGSSNNTGYTNPEADALIAQGDAAGSVEEGVEFYNQAEDLILEDMPIIPMWFGKTSTVHGENVSNVVVGPDTLIDVAEVTVNQ